MLVARGCMSICRLGRASLLSASSFATISGSANIVAPVGADASARGAIAFDSTTAALACDVSSACAFVAAEARAFTLTCSRSRDDGGCGTAPDWSRSSVDEQAGFSTALWLRVLEFLGAWPPLLTVLASAIVGIGLGFGCLSSRTKSHISASPVDG